MMERLRNTHRLPTMGVVLMHLCVVALIVTSAEGVLCPAGASNAYSALMVTQQTMISSTMQTLSVKIGQVSGDYYFYQ